MSGRRIPLFSLFGFQVWLDFTWIVLALLVTWSLAAGLFPYLYPELTPAIYWAMGVAGAVGLFLSIIVHELSHSLVGRLYGMPIRGITLFIFGGVAELADEPVSPKAEFHTAIVGPLTSIALGALCYLLVWIASAAGAPTAITGLLGYLAGVNLMLAVFNMVPAFPLDGGRVLRAALWAWKGRYRWATRVASRFGEAFGLLLILLAVLSVISGNFIGGMWWFLIGLFVRGAAQSGYQRAVVHEVLRGMPVRRLMRPDPVAVPAAATVAELVDGFFYRYYFKSFPVVDGDRLVGMVNLRDIHELPHEQWARTEVSTVMQPASDRNTVTPDTDGATALEIMTRNATPRLAVAADGHLLGLLSQTDILRFLSVRVGLEEGESGTGFAAGTHGGVAAGSDR